MKTNKQTKFAFQKYEIAKLKKGKIIGGTGNNNGDPDTGTKTSDNCSKKPGCKNDPNDPNNTFDPYDPNNDPDTNINK